MLIDGVQLAPGSTFANVTIDSGTSFPSDADEGELYFRSDLDTLHYYNGEDWMAIATGPMPVMPTVPYDIAGSILSKPTANAIVMRFIAPRNFSLPAGLVGSVAFAGTPATAQYVLSVRRNGAVFGTITFGAGSNSGVFAAASATTFNVGDVMTVSAPATADATFNDAQMTFVATLA